MKNTSVNMPLRYNNDKRKKPLFSRGLSVCRHLFNSFSKLKHGEKNIEKKETVSLTTKFNNASSLIYCWIVGYCRYNIFDRRVSKSYRYTEYATNTMWYMLHLKDYIHIQQYIEIFITA